MGRYKKFKDILDKADNIFGKEIVETALGPGFQNLLNRLNSNGSWIEAKI